MNQTMLLTISARASGSTTSPAAARRRHARRYIDEFSVTGLTSNPTIFDAGDRRTARLRRRHPRASAQAGRSGEASVLRARARRSAPRGRPVPARRRRDGWRRRLGVARGLAAARRRHRRHDRGGAAAASRRRDATQPLHQDSGHAGRRAGDRGIDLRRRADQRHAAVLARAVPRRRRSLHARHRAPHRRRPRSERRIGRVAVRQPLGRRRLPTRCRRVAQPSRHRRRAARPTAPIANCCFGALAVLAAAGARPQRLLWASTGTKDPNAPDTLYVERSPRPTRSTPCPRRRCSRSPTTASRRRAGRATAAMPRRCSPQFAQAGIDVDALAAQLQDEGAQPS